MALLKWLIIGLLVLGLAVVVVGQVGLLHGSPPADLGVHGGRLKAPSMTPNSVSSQADEAEAHRAEGRGDHREGHRLREGLRRRARVHELRQRRQEEQCGLRVGEVGQQPLREG